MRSQAEAGDEGSEGGVRPLLPGDLDPWGLGGPLSSARDIRSPPEAAGG